MLAPLLVATADAGIAAAWQLPIVGLMAVAAAFVVALLVEAGQLGGVVATLAARRLGDSFGTVRAMAGIAASSQTLMPSFPLAFVVAARRSAGVALAPELAIMGLVAALAVLVAFLG